MSKGVFYISETAKEVQVENHVLRYWEEELGLPVKRNAQGHRYYTKDDIAVFQRVKQLKERGLQLKAIKLVLAGDRLQRVEEKEVSEIREFSAMPDNVTEFPLTTKEDVWKEEKMDSGDKEFAGKVEKLQVLLRMMIGEILEEYNDNLCSDVKESLIKELDYQFRMQEERMDERDKAKEEKQDHFMQRLEAVLGKKKKVWGKSAAKLKKEEAGEEEAD